MRILMLCYFFQENLGFQENFLVREYSRQGHDVLVLAPLDKDIFSYYKGIRDRDTRIQRYDCDFGTLLRLPYKRFHTRKFDPLTGVSIALNEFTPDIIFVHNLSFNLGECVRYVRANPTCKLVMDFHGDASNSGSNFLSRLILHKLVKRAYLASHINDIDRVFAITPSSVDFLKRMYGVPRTSIELLPLGTNPVWIERESADRARRQVRCAIGSDEASIVLFTGGKLEPWKRTTDLIRAVGALNDSRLHLLIAGEVPSQFKDYRLELERLVETTPRVHLLGWLSVDELSGVMLASDLAVFPASQSILWQQAIGAGLPLIVGEINGQTINYMNAGNILMIRDEDYSIATLSTTILALADDPVRRKRMCEASRQLSKGTLSWSNIALRSLACAKDREST